MKTLFQKDSKLFLRTSEGEWEVSNPEELLPHLSLGSKKDIYDGRRIEWPGEFEVIDHLCDCDKNAMSGITSMCFMCPNPSRKIVRLLPKEEKKGKTFSESIGNTISTIQTAKAMFEDKGAMSYSEGDYKQFETVSSNTQYGGKFEIKSHYDIEPVESSEPQEKAAPVESQEELWREVLDHCELHAINDIRLLEYMVKRYSITRNP